MTREELLTVMAIAPLTWGENDDIGIKRTLDALVVEGEAFLVSAFYKPGSRILTHEYQLLKAASPDPSTLTTRGVHLEVPYEIHGANRGPAYWYLFPGGATALIALTPREDLLAQAQTSVLRMGRLVRYLIEKYKGLTPEEPIYADEPKSRAKAKSTRGVGRCKKGV